MTNKLKSADANQPNDETSSQAADVPSHGGPNNGDTLVLTAKPPNKQQQLAALVVRNEGATLDQMIAATGWLAHTTRAALTGLKKKGYVFTSDKVAGVRTYRAVAPE
jgi:hypothetical protein